MRKLFITSLFIGILAACVPLQNFAPLPLHDADLYPDSQVKDRLAVAVDQLTYPQRVKQYFGVDLIKEDMIPINIIVSNHGQGRYVIKPSDVLFIQGKSVVDPIPLKTIEAAVFGEYGPMSRETTYKIQSYLGKVTLRETVVAPQQNYQGIVFLKNERPPINEAQPVTMTQFFQGGKLKVRIAVTDLDTRERIYFGPFSLSGP